MTNLKIVVASIKGIADSQQKIVRKLQKRCFGNVNEKEIEEYFFSEGFTSVLAYHQNNWWYSRTS